MTAPTSYFESQDALTSRDSNGRLDVYQWERVGAGGAEGCSAAKPSFSAAAGGCIDLISSGQSERNSEIVDADPSGSDVFFATLSGLLPEDYGLVDIYDARVGGGLPSPPAPPIECEAENCQHPPAAPAFPTPSSLGYEGPANVKEGSKKPPPCPKGKHRAKKNGKSVCVKNKKKKNAKAKQRRAGA